MANQIFTLHTPYEPTSEATIQFKSSLTPQGTGECTIESMTMIPFLPPQAQGKGWQGQEAAPTLLILMDDDQRSRYLKLRAQQPSLCFFRQPASQKTQSKRKTTAGKAEERHMRRT